ncbi:MAG: hypothetical protein CMJ77_05925 [Planctomycetaceae bacterium]|nr:hypothetical protein [Planctomycetaceae bacterium]
MAAIGRDTLDAGEAAKLYWTKSIAQCAQRGLKCWFFAEKQHSDHGCSKCWCYLFSIAFRLRTTCDFLTDQTRC